MKQLLAHLKDYGSSVVYRKASSIYFQGEVPRDIVMVLDGIVKAYVISPSGDEMIVGLYSRGSVIPNEWINGQSSTALFNYDAVNDVRALKLSPSDWQAVLASDTGFQSEYIAYLSHTQTDLMLRLPGLVQPLAPEKICYTLYYLMLRYGLPKENGLFEIDLHLTQGTLASLIGQSRESTAKNLKSLKDVGVIDYDTATYTVNKPKLESYLGEDAFRHLDL